MKKRLVLLAALLTLSVAMFGCGGDKKSAAVSEPKEAKEEVKADDDADEEDVEEEDIEEEEVEDDDAEEVDVEESDDSDDVASALEDAITFAAMGVAESGETVYYAEADNFTILEFLNADSGESISFVGPTEVNDNAVTITDESNGLTFTFTVEEYDEENGTITLDTGSENGAGIVQLGECSAEEVVECLQAIDQYADAVS